MTREHREFLKSQGWYFNSELLELSKLNLQEIKERKDNTRNNEFIMLDSIFNSGKMDFRNPPAGIWALTFQKWILKKFGLKVLVDYLKNIDLKDKLSIIPGRLKALGVSNNDIEAALNPVSRIDKSKVVTLANRLTPRMDGDRSAAFIQAWTICKAGGLELTVKGVSFGNRQEALRRLAKYSPGQIRAVLVPEPTNPVDPAAVAIMVGVQNGRGLFRLGYVPRNLCQIVSVIGGQLPSVRVTSGTDWTGQTTYGARVALCA